VYYKGNHCLKTAKIREKYQALKTLLGLNELEYSLTIANSLLFMTLYQQNLRPSAYNYALSTVQALLPYEQHNVSVMQSLNFSDIKKAVLNVDKLTLSVLCAIDPLNVSQSDVCTATHSGLPGACSA
jgi:hypothetical protein